VIKKNIYLDTLPNLLQFKYAQSAYAYLISMTCPHVKVRYDVNTFYMNMM